MVYRRGFYESERRYLLRLAQLFNQSLAEGAVPSQWTTAVITPIPKTPKPTQAVDYRPISITTVLSRSLEKYIVRTFIYPALQQPYAELCFNDQFAFRPTGSTTAAIIACTHDDVHRAVRPCLLSVAPERI